MKPTKKESFEWLNLEDIAKIPKDRLIKAIVKTPKPTVHLNDPEYPIRLFAEAELMRNANLVGRPVGKNHEKFPIYGAYVVDSEWSEESQALEALLLVPSEYVKKVEADEIVNVSIEYTWRDIVDKGAEGKEFVGLNINRIDLLEGKLKDKAGDSGAVVSLFEASEKKGILLMEVEKPDKPCMLCDQLKEVKKLRDAGKLEESKKLMEDLKAKLGEPMGDYANWEACMKDCQENHPDVENCEEWCGSIKAQAEAKVESGDPAIDPEKLEAPPVAPVVTPPEKKPEDYADEETCKQAGHYWFDGACHAEPNKPVEPEITKANVEALTGAVKQLTKTVKDLKDGQAKLVADAKKEGQEEILKKVEAIVPKTVLVRQFSMSSKRLIEGLKRILYEARKEEK